VLVVALACVALATSGGAGARVGATVASTEPAFADGVVLVGFTPGAAAADRRSAEGAAHAVNARALTSNIELLNVGNGRVPAAIAALRGRAGVRYAEPDYFQTENAVPNDPSFGLQWGFRNTGQTVNGVAGTPGADEQAVPAWSVGTGSRSIVVAEVDSGVDYTHPDLAANVWSNPGGINGCAAGTHGYNIIAATCDPMDDETVYGGHGTHVAGIIGAVGNNSVGVTGVNWKTTILPVKWLNSSGSGTTSDLISALDWVLKAKQAGVNVRVVNDSATFVGTAPSQALSDEIDLLGQNNILFVTAAGNTGDNNDDPAKRRYPCGYDRPTEICVTASNQADQLPSWANYGPSTVDLAAPGNNIYSTLRGGKYGYISGGSMASPQVAGAAALILSKASLSTSDLKADILGNVDPLPALSGLVRTGGRLDVCKAMPGCVTSSALGTTSVGPNSDVFTSNRKRVNRYQLPVAASLPDLNVYLQPTATTGQQALQGIVYADSGGSPGALLATTTPLTFKSSNAAGWYHLTFASPPTLQPGTYWLGVLSGSTSSVAGFRWTSVAGSRAWNANTYTSGASNPFGTPTIDAEQMSLYATYTPVSGGGAAGAPVNTTAPSISGSAQQGQTLTASNGVWQNNPTSFAYVWRRCSSGGASCTAISGATQQTYALAPGDVGSTIRVDVTATNGSGSTTATSAVTSTVTPSGLTFGKATIGASTDAGTADWKRVCTFALGQDASVSKLTIYLARYSSGQQVLRGVIYADSGGAPGALLATSSEVTFGSSATAGWYDLPFSIPVALSAGTYWIGLIDGATTNVIALRYDSVTASSAVAPDTYADGPSDPFGTPSRYDAEQLSIYATYTAAAATSAPTNSARPAISGNAQQGQTLSASTGSWNGSPTSYAYQWARCDSSGANCANISGATQQTYVPVAGDVGSTIEVTVTASNSVGSASATSDPTTTVVGTLGPTAVGPNSDTMVADRKRVNSYQLSVPAQLTSLNVYLQPSGTAGQQVLRGIVYGDAAGVPGALLGTTNEITFHSTDAAGWYRLQFPSPVALQPAKYWIGLISGSTSSVAAFRWATISGSRAYNTNTYSSGPSDPFGTATIDSERMSVYALFNAG
jgi:subtilisin family serine protease